MLSRAAGPARAWWKVATPAVALPGDRAEQPISRSAVEVACRQAQRQCGIRKPITRTPCGTPFGTQYCSRGHRSGAPSSSLLGHRSLATTSATADRDLTVCATASPFDLLPHPVRRAPPSRPPTSECRAMGPPNASKWRRWSAGMARLRAATPVPVQQRVCGRSSRAAPPPGGHLEHATAVATSAPRTTRARTGTVPSARPWPGRGGWRPARPSCWTWSIFMSSSPSPRRLPRSRTRTRRSCTDPVSRQPRDAAHHRGRSQHLGAALGFLASCTRGDRPSRTIPIPLRGAGRGRPPTGSGGSAALATRGPVISSHSPNEQIRGGSAPVRGGPPPSMATRRR